MGWDVCLICCLILLFEGTVELRVRLEFGRYNEVCESDLYGVGVGLVRKRNACI